MTTYYFVGGEREAFIAGSDAAISWTTTSGRYDTDFSRGGVRLASSTSSSIYIDIPLNTPQLECYLGLMSFIDSGANGPNQRNHFVFVNVALTQLYRVMGIGGTTTQPLLQWQKWNGSAWVGDGAGRIIPADIIHKWDFEFLQDDTVGFARAYCDGVLLGEFSGDTKLVSPYEISACHAHPPVTSGATTGHTVSEVRWRDVTTLGRRLATLYLTGAGATNTFTAGAVTDIDEAGIYADTDIISSDTADQLYTGVTSDLSTTAQTYLVEDVLIAYRALIGGTGPQNMKGVVRIGGTDYLSPNNVDGIYGGLVTAMSYIWAHFPENPATTNPFTPAEINTAGFETGAKSLT